MKNIDLRRVLRQAKKHVNVTDTQYAYMTQSTDVKTLGTLSPKMLPDTNSLKFRRTCCRLQVRTERLFEPKGSCNAVEIKFNSNPGSFGKTTFVEDPNLTAALQKTRENSSAAELCSEVRTKRTPTLRMCARTSVNHSAHRRVRAYGRQPNGHVLVQFKGKTLGTQARRPRRPPQVSNRRRLAASASVRALAASWSPSLPIRGPS